MLREPYAIEICVWAGQKDCFSTVVVLEVELSKERWHVLILGRGIDIHLESELKS